jgi:hypothetical protein
VLNNLTIKHCVVFLRKKLIKNNEVEHLLKTDGEENVIYTVHFEYCECYKTKEVTVLWTSV